MTITATTNIRNEDNLFRRTAIRDSLGYPVTEQPARELGPLYDDLSTTGITVTTYFHSWGWYHVTCVQADSQETEDRFWRQLETIISRDPHLMAAA